MAKQTRFWVKLARWPALAVILVATAALFMPESGTVAQDGKPAGDKVATEKSTEKVEKTTEKVVAPASKGGAAVADHSSEPHKTFQLFSFLSDPSFSQTERILLFVVLGVAAAGLAYAWMLMIQVQSADQGTKKMQEVAAAIREGADAYLTKQLSTVAVMIVILVVLLFLTKSLTSPLGMSDPFAWGRAGAFLMGAIFSALVGFVGMRLATIGNLRVAAGATVGFGKALMLGYRTGTITGMLTDGLGLLGGTLIFMAYGEHAYEALLGFGFGGTLLALFMRVGGGIYTKAADVGRIWWARL